MFQGSMVAIVTPFDKHKKIDVKALQKLIFFHLENQTDAIVCTGTTGESSTLSDAEKLKVLKVCLKIVRKKIPVIAGTGSYNTKKTYELTKKARKLGADGALVVVPYYNKPTQEGIVAHYQEIAKAQCPVIVYHHPGRTSVNLSLETFQKLSMIKNIVAIKDASADLSLIYRLLNFCSLPVLSGDDNLTVKIMEMGGKGVISVMANILPHIWKKLTSLCLNKNYKQAFYLSEKYKELCDLMFLETNPQCIKYALSLMGKGSSLLRLPLLEPNQENKIKIKEVLQKYKLI